MANNTRQLGWAPFGAVMVLAVGLFETVVGLTALMNEQFLSAMGGSLLVWDLSAWGWIHLVFGLAALVVGASLWSGAVWSRSMAVLLVTLNMVAQFVFVSVYPLWAVALLVADLLVLYALTVRANE
ncbi:MAG: integral rane protein [Candidatus Saccharibacteria bacterium]|nr:integral rane protein [Candidatus Saccharibacteria bacterium]